MNPAHGNSIFRSHSFKRYKPMHYRSIKKEIRSAIARLVLFWSSAWKRKQIIPLCFAVSIILSSVLLILSYFSVIRPLTSLSSSSYDRPLAVVEVMHLDAGDIYIVELSDAFINETINLQTHLSRLLFWDEADYEKDESLLRISNSQIAQRNYGILDFYTLSLSTAPSWRSYSDFALSSTAFTQLYYMEFFQPKVASELKIVPSLDPYLINQYEWFLFPWLKSDIHSLYKSFNGRGLVITTGNSHFQYAFFLIKTLRNTLKCDLPIELVYANHNDLSIAKRRLLLGFKDVRLVDLSELVDVSMLGGVDGWWWKVFTIMMSSFSEVLFLEADVLFTVSPEVLFKHVNYLKHGTVIYRDRRIQFGHTMNFWWLKNEFPFPSETLKTTALWNETSDHEAESGVLVFNKSRPSAFFGLLNACNLNRLPMNDVISHVFWGDKETFWLGFELLKLPYAFDSSYGGAVGYSKSPGVVCGPLAHSDENGKLVWFNGGLAADKGINAGKVIDFQYNAVDDAFDTLGKWEWIDDNLRVCWKSNLPDRQVSRLDTHERKLFATFTDMYLEVRRGEFTYE